MHEYLMACDKYFGSVYRFQVLAANKEEAMKIGCEQLREAHDDNCIADTLRVVRKLKPSFGKTG